MGWTKQTFVDQETVITANFLNGLQDQIMIDEETVEDVENVQKVANAGKTVTIGLNGKLSASGGSGLTDRVKSALLGIFQHVAYADDRGQAYYNELYDALNNIELTGVEATFNQGTMKVYPSTPLDSLKKNLVVKAVYSNGEKVTTDDYTLSGILQVGTSTVTVTCGDYTDTFDVNVSSVAVTGIECVFNQGTAVIYESDSLTSLKQYLTVKVVYSDGTKEETINYSLSGTLVAGTSTITATYGSFTDTFDVVVSAVAVTSISCTYTQSKTVYDSDSLDVLKSDLAVNAVYSDGSSGTVPSSDYTLSGTLSAGTSTITVSYGGKTDTFSVTVTHRAGTYSVTNNLTNCTNSNGASAVIEGENYSGTITANSGYTMVGATVSVTMGGTDITSTAYNNDTVSIASVSGNIVINASAVAVTLSSISAVFTQGQTVVYDTDSLDVLKPMLVVTATYSDGATATIPSTDYTLSGTLSVGTSTITVTYSGKTDTFNVTVTESATTNYLANFDFTQSLIDKTGHYTPELSHGSKASKDAQRTSSGLVFDEPEQKIYFGKINPIGKTFEFDVASFSFAGKASYHMRLLMFTNVKIYTGEYEAWGTSPFIWKNNGTYNGYGYTSESTNDTGKGWNQSAWSGLTNRNVINGATVKIVFVSSGTVRLYINDRLIGTQTGIYYNGDNLYYDPQEDKNKWRGCQHVQFGGMNNLESEGDQCYNLTLSGFRVYENEPDSIDAVFEQGTAKIYTTNTLDDLKQYLTVTASYPDGTTRVVSNYTLSGTLTAGTSTITASYKGKTDMFNVIVEPEILYNWNFKESLVDSVSGAVAVTTATRDSNGLTFNTVNKYLDLGTVYSRNRTYEIDIDYIGNPDSSSAAYRRIFAFGENGTNTSSNTTALVVAMSTYRPGWYWYLGNAWDSSAIGSDVSTVDSYNYFDGKTMKIYIDSSGYGHVYAKTIGASDSTYVKVGVSHSALNNYNISNAHVYAGGDSDRLASARINAYRIYEGEK